MKQKSIVTLIATLAIIILTGAPVKANFLGLAPGDYTITLLNSTALCGTNCTGTVHIGDPGATGFDWEFSIQADNFSFDTPSVGDTPIFTDVITSCAVESLSDVDSCTITAANNMGVTATAPWLALQFFSSGSRVWLFKSSPTDNTIAGAWSSEARVVPEPSGIALLSFGALALYLRRRRQNR